MNEESPKTIFQFTKDPEITINIPEHKKSLQKELKNLRNICEMQHQRIQKFNIATEKLKFIRLHIRQLIEAIVLQKKMISEILNSLKRQLSSSVTDIKPSSSFISSDNSTKIIGILENIEEFGSISFGNRSTDSHFSN